MNSSSSTIYFTDPSKPMDIVDNPAGNQDVEALVRAEDNNILEQGTNQDEKALASFKTPDARKNDACFHDVSPTQIIGHTNRATTTNIEHGNMFNYKASMEKGALPGSPSSTTKTSSPDDFDAIVRQTQIALNQKLENNKMWAQKLLAAVATYSKALSGVHAEYARTQQQEHQEAQRLDQVEPDVHGATRHMLDNEVASMDGCGSFQKMNGDYTRGGIKRRLHQD